MEPVSVPKAKPDTGKNHKHDAHGGKEKDKGDRSKSNKRDKDKDKNNDSRKDKDEHGNKRDKNDHDKDNNHDYGLDRAGRNEADDAGDALTSRGRENQPDHEGNAIDNAGANEASDINQNAKQIDDLSNPINQAKMLHDAKNNPIGTANKELNGESDNEQKNNPIELAAETLGKKGLKNGKGKIGNNNPLYGNGKMFDTMAKGFGMDKGKGAGNLLHNNFAHSALNGAGNLAHNLGQFVPNAFHLANHGLQALGHFAGNMMHGGMQVAGAVAHGATQAMVHFGNAIGATTAQAATITGVATALTVGGVAAGITSSYWNAGQRDGGINSCLTNVKDAEAGADGSDGNSAGDFAKAQIKSVHHMYDYFHTLGWSDEAIAAMAGNWAQESFDDSTTVEHILTDHFKMTPKKKAATTQWRVGIGLGQWTDTENYGHSRHARLVHTAQKLGTHWWDERFQLAYVLNEPGMQGRLDIGKFKHGHDITSLTYEWLRKWEGIDDGTGPKRLAFAKMWLSKMKGWHADSSYAHSVMAMAKQLGGSKAGGGAATDEAVGNAKDSCAQAQEAGDADSSSLVKAALSFAWDSDDLAKGNNGTKLYQKVHKSIFPGDPFFKSCDRVVASAVRWSGTDVKFPAGAVEQQWVYMSGSSKWKKIGTSNSIKYSELKPGDVFSARGQHTFLFVGRKAVQDSIKRGQHKASRVPHGADEVDGSYGERSAGIGVDGAYSIEHGDGHNYTIFRCVKPDHSTKYKHVAANN